MYEFINICQCDSYSVVNFRNKIALNIFMQQELNKKNMKPYQGRIRSWPYLAIEKN